MSERIVIKQANRIVDVFFGEEGFEPEHWTRFIMVGHSFLKYVAGANMPTTDFNFVRKQLGVQ